MADKTWQVKGKMWHDGENKYVDVVVELTTEEYKRFLGTEVLYYRLIGPHDHRQESIPLETKEHQSWCMTNKGCNC